MQDRRLSVPVKLTFGLGELSLSTYMAAMTMVYGWFLLQEAELRPALAGAVPLIGREADAAIRSAYPIRLDPAWQGA